MDALSLLPALSVLTSLALLGCNGTSKSSTDAQTQEQNMPRTDVDGLERLINLPYRPVEVKWKTAAQPGRSDWSLRVLLRLSPEDMKRLLKVAGGPDRRDGRMSLDQLGWMPDAVRTETDMSNRKADLVAVDAIPIGVEQFAAPGKSPLIQGMALVFDKYNLVYLGLYTM